MTSTTEHVFIKGRLESNGDQKGRIEQIQFTDETISIGGSGTQAQTVSGAKTTGSAEAQVAALNEASNLDEAEKVKRKEAAEKAMEEAKQHKNEQKGPRGHQHEEEQGQQR